MSLLLSRALAKIAANADALARSTAPLDPDRRPSATNVVSTHLAHSAHDIDYVLKRGRPFHLNDIPAYIDALKNIDGGQGLDDRKMLLEKVLVLMSRLPPDSEFAKQLEVITIDILYKDLPHPPDTFLPIAHVASAPSRSSNLAANIRKVANEDSTPSSDRSNVHQLYAHTTPSQPYSASSTLLPNSKESAKRVGGKPYAARSADGSGYNLTDPTLGMAGKPYARTVPPTTPVFDRILPDAELIFDLLLVQRPSKSSVLPGHYIGKGDKRLPSSDPHAIPGHTVLPETDENGFAPHPGGLSSLFFGFANLIIHSIFDSSHSQPGVNVVSSYLDLSPLYGSSKADNNRVRRLDGTGRLWEDVFADKRILFMPPNVGALLILFCRNHNYIASKLLQINENKSYIDDIQSLSLSDKQAQDDELFDRSRLINCGWFMQGILRDYVGSILGLVRDGFDWRLDPLAASREIDHSLTERGRGNMVSMEFNFMYRWHHCLSQEDTKWTESIFGRVLGLGDVNERKARGENVWKIGTKAFTRALTDNLLAPEDVRTWTFDGPNGETLVRDPESGAFPDEDLAKILQNATKARAGAFKARGIPEVLRVVEVLGIHQSRSWGACTMNDFRRFMGLKPFASFSEWNSDPEISRVAETLYGGDIEQLELYVGLQAEESKPPIQGAGLCSGYTISRAILADAVALVRGDRFLTTEFNVYNLSSWGYQDVFAQPNDGAYGGEITRLLYRTLPGCYPMNSVYARFAFLDPEFMKEALEKRSANVSKYDFEKPGKKTRIIVLEGEAGREILRVGGKTSSLESVSRKRAGELTGKSINTRSFQLIGDTLNHLNMNGQYGSLLAHITESLLSERSILIPDPPTRYVDVTKHVLGLVPIHFVAVELLGLPLKTSHTPTGEFKDSELGKMLEVVSNYVFENKDAYMDWVLREGAQHTTKIGMRTVTEHLRRLMNQGLATKLSDSLIQWYTGESKRSDEFLSELLSRARKLQRTKRGKSELIEDVASIVTASLLSSTMIYAKAAVNVVEAFLNEHGPKKELLVNAAKNLTGWGVDGAERNMIWTYAVQALRANPPVSSLLFEVEQNLNANKIHLKHGQTVYCNLINLNQDSDELALGLDDFGLISPSFLKSTLPDVLRVIFGLTNIRLADGSSRKSSKFIEKPFGLPEIRYLTAKENISPFPSSLFVQFDF